VLLRSLAAPVSGLQHAVEFRPALLSITGRLVYQYRQGMGGGTCLVHGPGARSRWYRMVASYLSHTVKMSKHGKRKESEIRRREKGRPAVVADMLVGLRLPIETRQAVLEWAKSQPDQPNLSEAIRRLIDKGLLRAETAPGNVPSVEPSKPVLQVDEGGGGGQREPEISPQEETGNQDPRVEVEQTSRAVGWTPRVVETTSRHAPKSLALISALPPASPRPQQPATTGAYDNKPYQMPEDVRAFNEYWMLVERRLGRRLAYEEAVVLFNQERPASNYFIED
jgi:hypothetical protein